MLLAHEQRMGEPVDVSADGENRHASARGGAMAALLAKPLAAFFRRRLGPGNEAEIEDLVQDVFLRTADQLNLAEEEHARAYVFRVAASVWIDRHRRRQARQADQHVSFDPDRHDTADRDLVRQMDARETLRAATLALADLPERTRAIFILRRIEGLAVREVAARLGLSTSAVEKHMVRALEHILTQTRAWR